MGQCSSPSEEEGWRNQTLIDLRRLNNRTIKDGYSLPRIDDTLDCLHGAKWFLYTGPEVRLLAGGVRGGSQASHCIYHGPFRLLGM